MAIKKLTGLIGWKAQPLTEYYFYTTKDGEMRLVHADASPTFTLQNLASFGWSMYLGANDFEMGRTGYNPVFFAMKDGTEFTLKTIATSANVILRLKTTTNARHRAIDLVDTNGDIRITNDGNTANVFILTSGGNLWLQGDCSAASFTDRTAGFRGDALSAIQNIRNTPLGDIDHSTLPEFIRSKYIDLKGSIKDGRNLGNTVTLLIEAVRQLNKKIDEQDKEIASLKEKTISS
jgi:hypothetical protein